jgi:hypothetical protein
VSIDETWELLSEAQKILGIEKGWVRIRIYFTNEHLCTVRTGNEGEMEAEKNVS